MFDPSTDPDAALATQFQAGKIDPELYEKLLERIKRWICANFDLRSEAEDLAKVTTVEAYKSIHTYQARAAFFSWIITIAERVVASHYRKQQLNIVPMPAVLPQELDDDPDRHMLLRWDIDEALSLLTDEERKALALHLWEGYTHEEVAQILGLSSSNAAQQAFKRATAKIGAYLRAQGY